MDVSDRNTRGRAFRGVLAVAAVAVIAGVVAIASSGDVPAGDVRRPSDRLLDLVISFGLMAFVIALLAGAVIYAIGWYWRTRHGGAGRRSSAGRSVAMLAVLALALFAFVQLFDGRFDFGGAEDTDVGAQPGSVEGGTASSTGYEPEFTTVPVLIACGALLAALIAFLLVRRARRRDLQGNASEEQLPSLDDVLADTVDDLRSEPDPRRAVIAAYARLERALGAAGHPRRRSDAPGEYLGRVLRDAEVSPHAVERLTALFTRAKFSQHEIGEAMRGEAIEALELVREDLRAGAAEVAAVPA